MGADDKWNHGVAGLGPGVVLTILALQGLVLLILFLGWVGHWAWLRNWFPGGLFAGSFPIIVTWAGAAGGIANAVRGLTSHWPRYVDPLTSSYERRASNAWSISQGPLGAVYGSAAVLLLALLLNVVGAGAAGTLDLTPTGRLTLTAIAFIVGYHQQVFHDLVKRTVEAIFAPRARPVETTRALPTDTSSQSWQSGGYAGLPAASAETVVEQAQAGSLARAWATETPAGNENEDWPPEVPAAWSPEWDAASYVRDGAEQPSTAMPYDDDHGSELAAVDGLPVVPEPPGIDHEPSQRGRGEPAQVGDGEPGPAEAAPGETVERMATVNDDRAADAPVSNGSADGAAVAAEPDPAEDAAVRDAVLEDARTELDGSLSTLADGTQVHVTAGQPEPVAEGVTGSSEPEPEGRRRTRTGTTRRTTARRQGR